VLLVVAVALPPQLQWSVVSGQGAVGVCFCPFGLRRRPFGRSLCPSLRPLPSLRRPLTG
jgi:hypothetical protein